MIKTTDIVSSSQFRRLSMQDKEIYRTIRKSKPILKLRIKGYFERFHVIVNFNVKRENERTFFKFHIVEGLKKASESEVLYSVKGSILENSNEKCIIYAINDFKNNADITYIDNTSYISENICFNEVLVTPKDMKDLKHEYASVIINPKSSGKKEIMIDLESEIFKSYLNNSISKIILCDFVLFGFDDTKTNSQNLEKQYIKTFPEKINPEIIDK